MICTFQWFMVFLEQLMFTYAQPDFHTSLHMAQVFSCVLTDIDQRSQTGVIFRHGLQLGVCLFLEIKVTMIFSGAYNCGLSPNINKLEIPYDMRRSWMHFVCVSFRACGRYRTSRISFLYLCVYSRSYSCSSI